MRSGMPGLSLAVLAVVLFGSSRHAIAGGLPMPLKANLDLAESVVIGTITDMEETKADPKDLVRWSMATVTVRETLKGKEGKSISFLVASWLAPEGLHDMASPPHVYKKGDAGIWLVRSGRVSHTDGLLTEERRDEVKGILKSFAERKWSEPIQGLQFWASAVRPEYRSWPVLICAVRNASDEPNFLPLKGVVFVARDVTGKEYVYPKPLKPENEKRPVYCSRINPAELTYVPSNDWLNFDIVLECELPAGKYQILAFFQNDREGEIRDSKQSIVRVNAWKGKLAAEPFELVVEPGMRNR